MKMLTHPTCYQTFLIKVEKNLLKRNELEKNLKRKEEEEEGRHYVKILFVYSQYTQSYFESWEAMVFHPLIYDYEEPYEM